MAKQTSKSGLFTKYQEQMNKGHKAHQNDETDYGGGANLPPGIENGLAQLVDCRFAMYKKGDLTGEYYLIAAGVVKRPFTVKGFGKVAGLRTQIMEPMCDTPKKGKRKTVEDHIGWLLNFFRQFGVDTTKIEPKDYEAVAAALKEAKPFFRFRTWRGDKQEIEEKNGFFVVGGKKYKTLQAAKKSNPYAGMDPLTQETWRGKCDPPEDDEEEEGDSGLEVDEEEEEVEGVDVEEEEEEDEEEDEEEPETDDVNELAELADAGDESAGAKLKRIAMNKGIEEEAIDAIPEWSGVIPLIEEMDQEEEEEEEEEEVEEEESFEKEDMLIYRARLKSGGLSKKEVEVQVTAVNKNGSYNVRNLDTKKIIKNVSVEQLSEIEVEE